MGIFLVIDELLQFPTMIVGIYQSFEGAKGACDEYVKGEIDYAEKMHFPFAIKVDETECLRDYTLPNKKMVGYVRKVYSMTGYRVIKILEIEVES